MDKEFSDDFWDKMKNRMMVSFHKYGAIKDSQFTHHSVVDAKKRLAKYEETGNTEWLVDCANFCMIEFMFPLHENSHFRATDTDESIGIKRRKNG